MIYTLSVNSFNNTFAVKENGTKLTHFSGKRFKLFPFIANNNSNPIRELDVLVGRYLSQIEQKEPVPITAEELIKKLKDDDETDIQLGMDTIFEQVVRHMFFDKEGKIRPINLRMLAQTPCVESNECKLADYLVDVLGDVDTLQRYLVSTSEKADAQSNVLEKFVASKLETKPLSRKSENKYQCITNAVRQKFETDFEYILGARNRTRDYLIPLLEFYYFTYTAQAALQLNRFLDGNRNRCIPLYFCLEWEKTSQSRLCFSEGWNRLQRAVECIFAHAITLIISRICLYTKSPPKGGLFSILGQKEDNPMSKDEYYALLKAAHERTDWHDRDSIHAYNEYARELRKQMAEEDDKCFW